MGMKILLLTAKNWKKSDFLGFRIFEVILPCTAEYQYSLGTPLQIHQTHHTGTATQNFTPIFFCDVVMNLKKLSMVFWFLALWLEAPSGPYEKWVWSPSFCSSVLPCTADYQYSLGTTQNLQNTSHRHCHTKFHPNIFWRRSDKSKETFHGILVFGTLT